MNSSDKPRLLQQIAAISTMERGKLSTYSPNDAGAYFKLQHWEDGKNHTRHVSADDVPAVRAALDGYALFQQLTAQYADLVVAETRQNLAEAKKKRLRPGSFSLRRRKSGN